MDLVIGADGGGTKTACAIAQMNGRIIDWATPDHPTICAFPAATHRRQRLA